MSSYRLDYIAADTVAGVELVADSTQFEDRDDSAAMREATRLVKALGEPRASTERRTGRLWALHGRTKTLVGNVWQQPRTRKPTAFGSHTSSTTRDKGTHVMQIVTVAGRRWITARELDRLTAAAGDVAAHTPGYAILRTLPRRGSLTDAASTDVITTLVAVQSHPTIGSGLTDIAAAAATRLASIKRSGSGWQPAHDIGTGPETRRARARKAVPTTREYAAAG